jgi:hypothetical protein
MVIADPRAERSKGTAMTKDDSKAGKRKTRAGSRSDPRAAQRNQKQNRAVQLSAANVEESPHMDRRDSAQGAGESLPEGAPGERAGESMRRGAVDTQYGTRSELKTDVARNASSGGSGSSTPEAPNPGSSEQSSGAERDTMTGPRPGGRG